MGIKRNGREGNVESHFLSNLISAFNQTWVQVNGQDVEEVAE